MELKHYFVLVSIVVLPKLLFCLITPIRTGIFKVVHKHPKIKSCAEKILQKDEYSGGRVHELTGDCEGLNRSVSNKKTYDKGYAYFEQVSFREDFISPAAAWFIFDIPDFMYGLMSGKVLSFVMAIKYMLVIYFKEGGEKQGNDPNTFCVVTNVTSEEKTRFSFKFQTNDSMKVIIDNTDMCSLKLEMGNLGNIKQVVVSNPVQSFSYF